MLGLNKIVHSSVCETTGKHLVPFLVPERMGTILLALLTHLSIATGDGFRTTSEGCVLLRRNSKLIRRHIRRGPRRGYVDLLCGTGKSGRRIVVQAHRLVCIACMDSESVRKWCDLGRVFVSRHAVDCGRLKHCCSPQHMIPGTHKENWDDLKQVRKIEAKNKCRCRDQQQGAVSP